MDNGRRHDSEGKDAIRKWMASMDPQPPQFTIKQTIAEGDAVIARGDMLMQEKKDGPSIPYAFCDIYRFAGDQVVELTAFVIRTDKARTGDRATNESKQMASARQGCSALAQDVSARLTSDRTPRRARSV